MRQKAKRSSRHDVSNHLKDTKMQIKSQKSMFALETMDEVTLVKTTEFAPVTTMKEFLDRLGNDTEKVLSVLNTGLQTETRKSLEGDDSIPWMQETDDGKLVPFAGKTADSKQVGTLQLTLAKTVFGYSKDAPVEEKRAAKESALQMIRDTPKILEGLQKTAASASE